MVSTLLGGCVGIYFALNNYGALSIVYMTLSSQALASILYWTNNKWMPTGFYKESFKSLFKFGNKMLISRLINVVFENFTGVIITKFHSFSDFGLYTRADSLRKMPSRMLAGIVQTVSLPLLASLQDEPERLKDAYRRLIKTSMFLNLIVIFGLMVTAKSFILILLGEKWESVVLYLQLLCIPTLIFPMQSLNLNIISVKGRSDLHLKLELIKKITLLPIFAIGIFYGIIPMIWGLIANAAFSFYLNSYYSGNLINYPISEQIKDILPSVSLIALSSLAGYAIVFLNLNKFLEFFTQIGLVLGLVVLISEKIKLTEYLEVKKIVLSKINRAA
jgi:O-antigen/teichoic acid export membrane protein